MEGLKDRVAIVGMGCTKFGEHWDRDAEDLIVEAAYEAFEDAGVEPKDIQAAWVGTLHSQTGISLSGPLKLQYIPVTRVENMCATGSDAFRNACLAVASGVYDIVLALGFEKLKDAGLSGLGGSGGMPNSGVQPAGTAPGGFSQLATRYFHRYGINPVPEGRELLSRIAVKNHHNGSLNPRAHFQREITLEQAMKAPIVAGYLGLFDCCGVSDGAAAAVICRADLAKSFRADPIYVKACALIAGPGDYPLRPEVDYTHFEENVRAAKVAYEMAGIKNPLKELTVAEVHDCFTITELLICEDMGWAPRGRAKESIEAGVFELEGELAVNPDGGLKSFGHPIGASGLRMMYECYKQLQGKAGPRQRKKDGYGLVHNLGGGGGGYVIAVNIVGN
ncbi:MAG: acetyl-CoA acetyltransferase [Chloroflexi bacterium]|nr:acetyl-CoA acetyltransferase [Chloroflexota bacterium]